MPAANRLIHEKSPYLRQHAHNPVDWHAWDEEALARARAEDKPIFLSIGYSTCHWCHVMERESFENTSIAAILNDHFVCIKVDREERPDLDDIYMNAVQAMTGRGGWPLSVWLTPDLRPFYGGTYFPPQDRFGHPGFANVLLQLAQAYVDRRDQVESAASHLEQALSALSRLMPGTTGADVAVVDRTFDQLSQTYDPQQGGWGGAPKFPRSDFGSLCLRVFRRTGNPRARDMALHTLDAMAAGGMYDHLGGGFHRYSTDDAWLVPHFEKMLYDNAQLAFHYLEAHQITGRSDYATVAQETLEYVLRDLTDERGGFFSAEDADSEGEEGRFYVWTLEEIERLLPVAVREVFVPFYDVTPGGNFEGKVILRRVTTVEQLAARLQLAAPEVERRLAQGRQILLTARGQRVRPGLDDKILAGWNGLMITAFARAAAVLDQPRYAAAAARACDFVLEHLRTPEGLLRRWRDGQARFPAGADDHAFLVRGLLETYQVTFEVKYARAARELHTEMMELFADPADGALFSTRADQDDLLVRVKTGHDGSIPTANSAALTNCILLYELTAEAEYATQARRLLDAFAGELRDRPTALVAMVCGVDAFLADRAELVLAGGDAQAIRGMVHRARAAYHPDLVISHAPEGAGLQDAVDVLPNLAGKVNLGAATAYVCRAFACQLPTSVPAEMEEQLDLLRVE